MQVELDTYSGRPNPCWDLTAEQAAQFQVRLQTLKKSPARAKAADGLGYRGVVVRSKGATSPAYEEIRLYRGKVAIRRGGQSETFEDPDRALELWLVHSAQEHVDAATLSYVQSEVMR